MFGWRPNIFLRSLSINKYIYSYTFIIIIIIRYNTFNILIIYLYNSRHFQIRRSTIFSDTESYIYLREQLLLFFIWNRCEIIDTEGPIYTWKNIYKCIYLIPHQFTFIYIIFLKILDIFSIFVILDFLDYIIVEKEYGK